MAINEGLKTLLLAEGTVSTLLTNATTGVHLDYAPQSDKDTTRVEIHVISDDPLPTLGATSGMRSTELDIDCKSVTRPNCTALADAVEAYVKDLTGAAGSDTIDAMHSPTRTQDYEPPDGAKGYGRCTDTVNITCQWTPA